MVAKDAHEIVVPKMAAPAGTESVDNNLDTTRDSERTMPRWLRLNWLGCVGALLGFAGASTPSLPPRPTPINGGPIVFIAVIFAWVILLSSRGVRRPTAEVDSFVSRFVPPRLAQAISVIVVALVLYWVAAGIFGKGLIAIADNTY